MGRVQSCPCGKHVGFVKDGSKMTARLPEATVSRTEVGDYEEGDHGRNERITETPVKGEINSSMFQKKVDAGSDQNVEEAKRKYFGPHGTLQLEDHREVVPGIGMCKEERSRVKKILSITIQQRIHIIGITSIFGSESRTEQYSLGIVNNRHLG